MLPPVHAARLVLIEGVPNGPNPTRASVSLGHDTGDAALNHDPATGTTSATAAQDPMTNAAASSEPSTTGAPAAQSSPSQQPEEEQEPPIEELVSKAIIHADRPIEYLPSISPPELKLIGRCVTFNGDTSIDGEIRSFYYEGLVATINKETVMLIHVHRYTEEDFQVHKLERRQAAVASNDVLKATPSGEQEVVGAAVTASAPGVQGLGRSAATTREELEAMQQSRRGAAGDAHEFDFDQQGVSVTEHHEAPELLNELGETHAEATTRVRNRMRKQTGSMGPIPYVTFSRSHIHRVEFGVDLRSSFYSIFHDPTKMHFDMQCLRMFVRRYIIHTSQGNNPRRVPLRAFITCRCNCPDLDDELLVRTTREELAHLIKIDRDVRRMKKKKGQSRRTVLRAYRAPNGIFRLTGVLYLTHLPRQTLTIAVMEMFVTLVVLAFMVSTFLTSEPSVVVPYLFKMSSYIFATVIISVLATTCTALHSIRMKLPVREGYLLVGLRGFFTMGAIACSTMLMIVAGEQAGYERFRRFTDRELGTDQLCHFYDTQRCSGIDTPCTYPGADPRFCACRADFEYTPYACQTIMLAYMQRGLIPLVCLTFMMFVVYLFDVYLHLRLFHIAHLLERRM